MPDQDENGPTDPKNPPPCPRCGKVHLSPNCPVNPPTNGG